MKITASRIVGIVTAAVVLGSAGQGWSQEEAVAAAIAAEAGVAEAGVVEAAQPVAPPQPVVVVEPEVEAVIELAAEGEADKGGALSGSSDESGRITVSLDDVELDDVVRLFIRLSGANIICNATNLQGRVTANLQDVEWQPAFKAIIARHNMVLQEDLHNKGIYYVEPRSPDAPDPWITETFKLDYLKSSEAAELLKSLLGLDDPDAKVTAKKGAKAAAKEGEPVKEDVEVVFRKDGRVVSYPAGNMVVVSTTEARMAEVRGVLAKVDVPRQQVYIEAKIVELQGEAGKKVGLDWSMLDGYMVGVGEIGRRYTKDRSRERGSSRYAAGTASAAYDHTGKQLSTESAAGATRGSVAALAPVAIANQSDIYAGVQSVTPGAIAQQGGNEMSARFRSISDVSTAIFAADALSLVLSALETSEDATFVSNPKVIVANEERAIIDMATKEPYVTVEMKTDGTGDNTTYTITTKMDVIPGDKEENKKIPFIEQAFFTYGIKLEVTPRINNASNITVNIAPTLSKLVEYYMPAGEGSTRYPKIDSKHVSTIFSLGDGQTAVIGGLTRTSDSDVVKKVPLLGDIPILGKYLFTHTSKQKTQVETVIFVTVGIVNPERPEMALAVPEASKLIHSRVDSQGRLLQTAPPVEQEWPEEELVDAPVAE